MDGLGLDVAARGLKTGDQRPDLIILDDIDERHDTDARTAKKKVTLTDTIIPLGSANAGVLALQNLIIPGGIFAQLANGTAGFLTDRLVSGPTPAIRDLQTQREERSNGDIRTVITSGEPTWAGQDISVCQALIDKVGFSSFLREQQHEVDEVEGALWTREMIRYIEEAPTFKRVVIGVDPSGGKDEIGIVAAGLGLDNRAYIIHDETQPGPLGPLNWGQAVVALYDRCEADRIVVEKNFGGEMVEANIRMAADGRRLPIRQVHASRGKVVRAEPIVTTYEDGRVVHVGAFPELELEMTRWVPGDPSPNRVDALVWALTELLLDTLPAPTGFVRLKRFGRHRRRDW